MDNTPHSINAIHIATKLAQEIEQKPTKSLEETIPKVFHPWLHRFDKAESKRLPEHKEWDHKIELKPGWTPKPGKI
jgi:hypothetical protein